MSLDITQRTLKDYRWPIFGWSFGMAVISLYVVYFFPFIGRSRQLLDMVEYLPPMVRNLLGDRLNLATPEGFFSIQPFSMVAPLVFLFFAISKGADTIAGEAERGTLDMLLAAPVPRGRLLFEKWLAIVSSLFIIGCALWSSMLLAALWFGVSLSAWNLLAAVASCFLLGTVFLSLSIMVSGLFLNKRMTVGILSGYAIIGYLINAYSSAVPLLRPYRYATLFYFYNGNQPLIYGLDPVHIAVMILLTLVFLGLSWGIFSRRDIVV